LVCFEELVEVVFEAGVFKPELGEEGAVEIQEDVSSIDELTGVELGELLQKESEEVVNFDEVLELTEAHAAEVLRLEQLQACLGCVELLGVLIRKLHCAQTLRN
jgi:hypothetical protein